MGGGATGGLPHFGEGSGSEGGDSPGEQVVEGGERFGPGEGVAEGGDQGGEGGDGPVGP